MGLECDGYVRVSGGLCGNSVRHRAGMWFTCSGASSSCDSLKGFRLSSV